MPNNENEIFSVFPVMISCQNFRFKMALTAKGRHNKSHIVKKRRTCGVRPESVKILCGKSLHLDPTRSALGLFPLGNGERQYPIVIAGFRLIHVYRIVDGKTAGKRRRTVFPTNPFLLITFRFLVIVIERDRERIACECQLEILLLQAWCDYMDLIGSIGLDDVHGYSRIRL